MSTLGLPCLDLRPERRRASCSPLCCSCAGGEIRLLSVACADPEHSGNGVGTASGRLVWLWYFAWVILIVLVCFFPVAVAMLTGLTQSDPKLADYMNMIGASRQRFWRLELPGSVPYLFSGLKIAASYSVISAIYAEATGASKGLGYYMELSKNGFKTANVFAAIAIIVMLSLLFFGLINLAERLLLRGRTIDKGE